ncbi:hypothetical protein BDN70DRAFT_881849 [Pholiota conissans]|uniref:Uncharacterized protein n=1 Tax=Pholiota conissans TaxID=109636 RepID=A0A9P5YWB0_9AGAR|nr:hypothetical protein BDN70DRAFT_881849 [Pholiota conissans]
MTRLRAADDFLGYSSEVWYLVLEFGHVRRLGAQLSVLSTCSSFVENGSYMSFIYFL